MDNWSAKYMKSRQLRQLFATAIVVVIAFVWFQSTRNHRKGSLLPATSIPALVQGAEPGPQTAEDHFSPAENLEQIDVARIRETTHTLDIAMFAFTDTYLAEAIVERARAGVKVRLYRDKQQFGDEENKSDKRNRQSTTSLMKGESNIEIRVKGKTELMHLKAYLVDGQVLRTGSANWSPSGLKRQDNNAHFTTDPAQVKAFQGDFEEMWSRDDNRVVQ